MRELLLSTTLVPPDLALLDDLDPPDEVALYRVTGPDSRGEVRFCPPTEPPSPGRVRFALPARGDHWVKCALPCDRTN